LTTLNQLQLHNNHFSGQIPSKLGDLYNLTHLYLSTNQLTGNIPTDLGNLTNLLDLRLQSNQLTGGIPIQLEEFYTTLDRNCLDLTSENLAYTFTQKEYHYTLYYYDQSGSLVQTVPPAGVQPLSGGQIASVKNGTAIHPYHRLQTRYRYNSRNQLVWQESPDGGKSSFWYNRAGQLRLSQNAKQATGDLYSYTRYDRQGRVTETGELASTAPIGELRTLLEDASFPDCGSFGCGDVTLTAYDRAGLPRDPTFAQEYLRSRVSWTAMAERDAADTVYTYYSYDPHEDRALKIAPVEQFSEGPGCRGAEIPAPGPSRNWFKTHGVRVRPGQRQRQPGALPGRLSRPADPPLPV
jgi:hypothetical protein